MDKHKVLSQIKLKYHYPKNEKGERPVHGDLKCDKCGKAGISVGASFLKPDGSRNIYCEDCAIDDYMVAHKFSTREAAEARRRRIFDISYLFNEMITDKYLDSAGLDDIKDLSEKEMREIFEKGKAYYNSLFSKNQKIKLEETDDQEVVEKVLKTKLEKIKLHSMREKMPVEFTRDQYETLLKLAYAGDWLINSIRDVSEENPCIKEFRDLESYLFSKSREFGLEDLADYDKKSGIYYPSRKIEEEMDEHISEYDDDTFFEELVSRFEIRDFERTYDVEEIKKMDWKERINKRHPFYEKYFQEFVDNDIDRLEIKQD